MRLKFLKTVVDNFYNGEIPKIRFREIETISVFDNICDWGILAQLCNIYVLICLVVLCHLCKSKETNKFKIMG